MLEMVFKTEFLTLLSQKVLAATGRSLRVDFTDTINFTVKKVFGARGSVERFFFQFSILFLLYIFTYRQACFIFPFVSSFIHALPFISLVPLFFFCFART